MQPGLILEHIRNDLGGQLRNLGYGQWGFSSASWRWALFRTYVRRSGMLGRPDVSIEEERSLRFHNQPLATRYGIELLRHIDQTAGQIDPFWDSLDIAVAWVRGSGMSHLSDGLKRFLQNGGELSVIVGIDLQNTTREGLQALLDLEQHGQCETFVYHNEAGSIFHPKLYLFRNDEEARLIVGSNNITESGLYVNVEAGLQVDTTQDAVVVGEVLDALASWKDTSAKFSFRLTSALLTRLVAELYVPDEATSKVRLREAQTRPQASASAPLFASRRFAPPARPTTPQSQPQTPPQPQTSPQPQTQPRPQSQPQTQAAAQPQPTPGTVLLMRLRKASVTGRPTQTQLPFRVAGTFFRGVNSVRSAHDGYAHGIIQASARGGRNTIKLEIPEMRDFQEPVARFERKPNGEIVYEAYDVGTPGGNQIMADLQAGRRNGTTQMTISNPQSATWWRLI
jgi:hypothetical protein